MRALAVVMLAAILGVVPLAAQRGGRGAPPAPPVGAAQAAPTARSARAAAPFDPTGYWVSLVSDEWRYRMLTPPKGNVDYVPVTPEARRVANEWDPAKDEAAGEQCRGYGVGGIMRLPVRLHITWADERTLRIDIDAGRQTRLLHFGGEAPSSVEATWQGYSAAEWSIPNAGRGRGPQPPPKFGQLKVVTTHARPGYLRKNGVPYSANAVLTEYFQHLDDEGTEYLAVTSSLEDPQYLAQPWVRTSQYRKQPDAKGWNPTPCSAR